MFPPRQVPARAALALAGATAVVAAELLAVSASVRLAASGVDGAGPVSSLPVVAVSVGTTALAVAMWRQTDGGTPFTVWGMVLILAAPVTAFGGDCGAGVGDPEIFRSGVRIGIAADGCVTFLNGALLVVGYGLLAAGLWLVVDELPVPDPRQWQVPGRSD